jgi:anti-sigma factor RsiW
MTPQKFYDYLEGKLPDDERQELERTLIHDPELQRQFVAARQVHRSLNRPPDDSVTVARAGARGRQVAAACALLVM